MAEEKVVLVRMTRDAQPGQPDTADVHPAEVANYQKGGWIVKSPVESDLNGHTKTAVKEPSKNTKKVFVVHGRNEMARKAMFSFLRSLSLDPIEWSEAVSYTEKGTPYIGEVLEHAFNEAQAVVVLFTGDDICKLSKQYLNENNAEHESTFTPQARPNVLFEAGLAFGTHPDRTILIELGKIRPFSDIGGRNVIRLDDSANARQDLVNRLRNAGCAVNVENRKDWLSEGNFDEAVTRANDGSVL